MKKANLQYIIKEQEENTRLPSVHHLGSRHREGTGNESSPFVPRALADCCLWAGTRWGIYSGSVAVRGRSFCAHSRIVTFNFPTGYSRLQWQHITMCQETGKNDVLILLGFCHGRRSCRVFLSPDIMNLQGLGLLWWCRGVGEGDRNDALRSLRTHGLCCL